MEECNFSEGIPGWQIIVTDASAFSPCTITGAFRIHSNPSEPLKEGSTGLSLEIQAGVVTRVRARRAKRPKIRITFNKRLLLENSASVSVARKFQRLDGSTWDLEVRHESKFPIGHGYGTSGAGTLGLSLALNELMNLGFDRGEVAQIAHLSEISCRTGLGTVASALIGGMNLRLVPGAPGYGKTEKILTPPNLVIVTATLGPISTENILTSSSHRMRIKSCGEKFLRNFDRTSPQKSFMEVSRSFFQCSGLASSRLTELIGRLDSKGFYSSMVMLGQSLFLLPNADSATDIVNQIQKNGLTPVVTSIAEKGAELL